MNKSGPIIVIEDDEDDRLMFKDVFTDIDPTREITFFVNGDDALKYLVETKIKPFLILSDINMPKLNGFELRDKLHNNEELRLKCIPFLFFTTSAEQRMVVDAYSKSVQGFFVKPSSFSELINDIKIIVDYWKICHSPNVIV